MRLHALRLTNFRQHASTVLEFGSGITGIIGPNGSGKTTILEAIAWALYGNEAARGRRDSIRFHRADPKAPVRVELEFELSGHRYRVVRGLTAAELYLDGGAVPIANSLTAVNDAVQRRLGMSRAEFFNTYFTGQKELSVMTALGPTERAQFLSRVLGYERLRAAQELARERRRELIGELAGMRQSMPDPTTLETALTDACARAEEAAQQLAMARDAHARATAEVAERTAPWEAAQETRARRQQLLGDMRVAEHESVSRARDLERTRAAVADAERAHAELAELAPQVARVPALRAERDALNALARDDGRRQALADALKAAEDDMVRLADRRALLTAAAQGAAALAAERDGARAALRAADAALDTARTAWARDRQDAETRRDALRVQYIDVKTQRDRIVDAGEDGVCPTCRRPLGAHFRDVHDALHAQLETLRVDGSYYKARLEQLATPPVDIAGHESHRAESSAAIIALERRIAETDAAVAAVTDLARTVARHEERLAGMRAELAALPGGYDPARHADVRRELERLTPLAERAHGLAALIERADAARAELTAAATAHETAARRLAELHAATERLAGDDAAFEQLQRQFAAATTAASAAEHAVREARFADTAAADAVARARAAAEEAARAQARIDALARERRMHDELDDAFTDLRTDLNFALRPELSRLASVFVAKLTDDRYTELDLDDQYNLVIVEDGVPKPVISGGEEDLANLVLRLAISQMIAERAGQAFSLLILDEVFGSLDDVRRQNVVDLLRSLGGQFEQVVLITHIEAVRDGCDRVLLVRFDPSTGASAVRVPPGESRAPAPALAARPDIAQVVP